MTTVDHGFDIFDVDPTERIDRIGAEAKQIRFRRSALVAVAAVLVAIGWSTAKAVRIAITALGAFLAVAGYTAAKAVLGARAASAWCIAAVMVGWQAGYQPGSRAANQ